MLPAPLAVTRNALTTTSTQASASTTVLSRSSEDGYSEVGSQQRLVPSPGHDSYTEEYDTPPVAARYQSQQSGSPFQDRVSRTATQNAGVLRQATTSQYPGETQNPYSYQMSGYESPVAYTAEPDELPNVPATAHPVASPYNRSRGISLADNGPVPGPEGVRRVSRQPNKRPTSQAPPQNRYSRSSSSPYPNLPPGAAPPQPGYGY
jgi:chitin synthase